MKSRTDIERIATVLGGVPVLGVTPNAPASRAGVQRGDVVMSVDGKRVRNWQDYFDAFGYHGPERTFCIWRDGVEFTFSYPVVAQDNLATATELLDACIGQRVAGEIGEKGRMAS